MARSVLALFLCLLATASWGQKQSGNASSTPARQQLAFFGTGGAPCDPTAGSIRFGATVYAASSFDSCGPETGGYYAPSFSVAGSSRDLSIDYGPGGARSPRLSSNSTTFSGATCAAGFQCMPTAADCSAGVCETCEYGRYCPNQTSNRFATADYNVCPGMLM